MSDDGDPARHTVERLADRVEQGRDSADSPRRFPEANSRPPGSVTMVRSACSSTRRSPFSSCGASKAFSRGPAEGAALFGIHRLEPDPRQCTHDRL